MNQRRAFITLGASLALIRILDAKTPVSNPKGLSAIEKETIRAVLDHFFPHNSALPSAESVKLISFIEDTISHPSFDKDIRRFVKKGARKLHQKTNGRLMKMSSVQRERSLRSFERSDLGEGWLSRIMILGLEGLLGDPIYGANVNEAGWRALGVKGGIPRPKVRYLGR